MKRPSNPELRRSFEIYLASRRFGKNTRSRYRRYAVEWLNHLGGKRKNALDATIQDATEFWTIITERYKPPTQQQVLTVMHTFYKWLQTQHVTRDPFVLTEVDNAGYEPRQRPIVGPDELLDMIDGWQPILWKERRDRALVAALVATGARCDESCKMDVPDIDWRKKAIHIHGKGGVPGWGSLQSPVDAILREWIDVERPLKVVSGEKALFINNRGTRVKSHTVRAAVVRVRERTGIQVELTPHGIRHSDITEVYRHSKDVRAANRFARHKNLQTTMGYIHGMPDEVLEIAEEHHPLAWGRAVDFKRDPDEED